MGGTITGTHPIDDRHTFDERAALAGGEVHDRPPQAARWLIQLGEAGSSQRADQSFLDEIIGIHPRWTHSRGEASKRGMQFHKDRFVVRDAPDPSLIVAGRYVIGGAGTATAVVQILDIDDGVVHVRPIRGSVASNRHLLDAEPLST